MRKSSPLDALIPKVRQRLLAATLLQPHKPWYISELARHMNVRPSTLQRELRALTAAGILQTHSQGRMVYYQANRDSPIFAELGGLMLKTAGLVDILKRALAPFAKKLRAAFVYGSVAGGAERSESDVDLMVIGDVRPADLALPLRRAQQQVGRPINPTVYTASEFERKRQEKNHFLTQVLRKPKLFVIGNQNELETAAR